MWVLWGGILGCWSSPQPSLTFDDAFAQGEAVGQQASLVEIVEQAHQHTGDARANFLDGAAHTYRAPENVSFTEQAAQIEQIVPQPHRDVFHDGVAQQIITLGRGDPQVVLPQIDAYQQISYQPLYNGVRIGFWRVYKEDVLQGLAIAQAYPSVYHAPLMEEFGWLLGDQYVNVLSMGWSEWRPRALPDTECALLHGMVRGWWMRHLAENTLSVSDLLRETRQISACPVRVWRGVGWAMRLIHGEGSSTWLDLQNQLHPTERDGFLAVQQSDTFWE